MMYKRISLFVCLAFLTSPVLHCFAQSAPQESDQQIGEFSLSGYADKGKKSWDIAGKSADIFDNVVKLQEVVGNLYGEKENITLVADKGDFDKTQGKVHLQENVVITTTTGATLSTDSLDWDRKNQLVTTKDEVNIVRSNMTTTATGATGEPNLNKIKLEKDVTVDITPESDKKDPSAQQNKIIITCDGPLEIDYAKNVATFKNNVKVDTQDNLIYSDAMDVYFNANDSESAGEKENSIETAQDQMLMGAKIDKIVARGNVRIIKGENTSYSQEAIYTASDKRIVLTGKPKLVIFSTEDLDETFRN